VDFSKRYIKMCEEAKEIQNLWKPHIDDYVYDENGKSWTGSYVYVLGNEWAWVEGNEDFYNYRERYKVIWLPRQDQLQAIITTNKYFRFGLIELFYHFANKNISKFTSMEQLWLAFVMYVKYNKIWNNKEEKWVENKSGLEKRFS